MRAAADGEARLWTAGRPGCLPQAGAYNVYEPIKELGDYEKYNANKTELDAFDSINSTRTTLRAAIDLLPVELKQSFEEDIKGIIVRRQTTASELDVSGMTNYQWRRLPPYSIRIWCLFIY